MKTLDEFTQEQNQITESMIYDDMIKKLQEAKESGTYSTGLCKNVWSRYGTKLQATLFFYKPCKFLAEMAHESWFMDAGLCFLSAGLD